MKVAQKPLSVEASEVSVRQLVSKARRGRPVFLTVNGKTKFRVVPADEFDEEIKAQLANPELMEYLSRCSERARRTRGKSTEDMRKKYGLPAPGPMGSSRAARAIRKKA